MERSGGRSDHEAGRAIVEVSTGEVKTGDAATVFSVSALGSCIAVIAYDPFRLVGGIAHVMLPGKSGKKPCDEKLRYADDAIAELLARMEAHGSPRSELVVCLAGGGNVLQRSDDSICTMNIGSVLEVLSLRGIPVAAQSLGGNRRRRVKLDITKGCILCAEGNEKETILWQNT
ncbi:MAG: hypothetical protein C0402_11015 [Thermodesulfovibrio sp.]|nr:hypothetical protein [Thermodesulfovibrio sp.]